MMFFSLFLSADVGTCNISQHILWMEEILHQLIDGFSPIIYRVSNHPFGGAGFSQPSTVTHQCSKSTSEFDRFSQLKWANYLEHMDPKRNSGTAFDGQYQEIQVFTRTQLEHRIPFLANQASSYQKT